MSFLAKGTKKDLQVLAQELGEVIDENLLIVQLKNLILKSPHFEENFVKERYLTIITQRKEEEDRNYEMFKLEHQHRHELDKLKVQAERVQTDSLNNSSHEISGPKFDPQKLLPCFKPQDDISLYLVLFERQAKILKIPEELLVSYLVSCLPVEIAKLVAREPEEKAQDFQYIKTLLLKRFKLSAEKFRILFSHHRKSSESTWTDFYYELRNYFEGWLSELNIATFDDLKDLIISDQMKKRSSPECKEHFLDSWSELNNPADLAEKLEEYENVRGNSLKENLKFPQGVKKKFGMKPPEYDKIPKIEKNSRPYAEKRPTTKWNRKFEPSANENTALKCFGCGKVGFVKRKCPNCNPPVTKENEQLQMYNCRLLLYNCNTTALSAPNVKVTICNKKVLVCADTGANRSIAGQRLYELFKINNVTMKTSTHELTLADGITQAKETLSATVPVEIEGRIFKTEFVILPQAKGNRTLLGMDFLQKAKVVLNTAKKLWHFSDNPRKRYPFVSEVISREPISAVETNPYALRKEEGKSLTLEQRKHLNSLLKKYENCFHPGGETTPYVEHRINTGDNAPVAMPPYRMSPAKKEILKKEIDNLLAQGTIEECESPYASPVVLVPKPDGTMRLCIDYRKLNAITIPDTYPMPRMDDLLQEAKHTSFMSTLDLRSGYHQVRVYPPHQDKTAFVCPFGTYRYLKMPFGLRNAPATFQRLIDQFRNGLKDVLALSYLDDIIILSDTFEKHISDLEAVFERLSEFKLNAKREKCHFACDKVKYLGHWITPNGLEVDPTKVEAIANIPPPTTVKQVQSFLQTCSWYRRFIPQFADISRPLSNLTKKKSVWRWRDEEQKAFETLKKCLTTSPVLKQADGTKPFIIRTDASSYALGAVLLQGDDKTSEHPIEYASRLLTNAEKNYSTTEREALAVIWALGKFRGYIEHQKIIIATDHQPLKWLMSLKSPSGRLARWSLLIQSYDLNIDYLPGKSNVVADMLSRPVCSSQPNSSETCNFVCVDMPTRSPSSIREAQLNDENLKKIIDCFESNQKNEDFVNWTERGYLMNQGILYRYAPDSDAEEAQLVIPAQERQKILNLHHDIPTAGHYGEEGTYQRIAQRYYWTGMKSYIANYVKNCPECCRFKASNQKPAGLLRTPVYSQRFETVSIDLFGPLPESKEGHKWIFIVEDCTTRWVELFPLISATAHECAITLIEEVFFRYGIPRRLISDNGSQFISAVLQQVCCTLDIDQVLTPVYHPQANPVERKNRDLKPRLAILVGDAHDSWADKLPYIRFALNSAKSDTTGHTAAYLQFGRELRTIDDVVHDLKAVLDNDNFVPEITPFLKRLANISKTITERVEMKQDQRKAYYDRKRRTAYFSPGEKVWVTLHPISNRDKKKTAKFMPKRDGPYLVLTQRSPVTYEVANLDNPNQPVGTYHVSALKPFCGGDSTPIAPLRKRGRPKKQVLVPPRDVSRNQRGRM